MTNPPQHFTLVLTRALRGTASALALACALTTVAPQPAQAQTFTVVHAFTGGADGGLPQAGVTMDASGNLYGTASEGGLAGACGGAGCGTVYKLARHGSGWVFYPLYSFTGGSDGAFPVARMIVGANGTLYSTTFAGGDTYGYEGAGVVFNLRPPPHVSGRVFSPWTETVLHTFAGGSDGANPDGDLLFDRAGNVYGTASCSSASCRGTVYELTPSGGGWTEAVLYEFTVGSDGYYPQDGVIFDDAGNLYGVTTSGGTYYGTVFQLTPSQGGWAETVLHSFQSKSDGAVPVGGLIFDSSGNLYGTAGGGGPQGGGTVFELTPSSGTWSFGLLYSFYCPGPTCYSLPGPQASLFMDSAGNLFGTTTRDGTYGYGNVFRLTPQAVGWTYTSLHDFTGGSDGAYPYGSVFEDASGNLFGTAAEGGTVSACGGGCGVVWEIMPD